MFLLTFITHRDIFSEHRQAFHSGSVNELPLIRVVFFCLFVFFGRDFWKGEDAISQSLDKTALYPGVCKACAFASGTSTNSGRETEPPSISALGREAAPGDTEVLLAQGWWRRGWRGLGWAQLQLNRGRTLLIIGMEALLAASASQGWLEVSGQRVGVKRKILEASDKLALAMSSEKAETSLCQQRSI